MGASRLDRDRARVWFPDGRTYVVPLRAEPKHGHKLVALGVREGAWVVSDVRSSSDPDVAYDVWVEAASS